MRFRNLCATLTALIALAFNATSATAADCDEKCLRSHLDQYLAALTKREPAALHLAPHVRFTENGKPGKVGDGLWQKASGLGTYRQYFVDSTSQQAMFIGVVDEDGAPVVLALRLGVTDAKVAEIEHVVARKGSHALFAPDAFVAPPALVAQKVASRLPREKLIAIADSYFEGIEQHNSKIILASDTCQRIENGVQTTNQPGRTSTNCAQSADVLTYIKGVNDRRYPIVDAAHGIVVATILFDIPGEQPNANAPQISADPQVATRLRQPRTLLLTEWFKIDGGKIQHIEAIMHNLPHGSKSGWERGGAGNDEGG
jgi:hypothetical protein